MTQYSTKTFTKDRFQWAKCVMQYVCQGLLAVNVDQMLVLLAEVELIGFSCCFISKIPTENIVDSSESVLKMFSTYHLLFLYKHEAFMFSMDNIKGYALLNK